MPTMERLTQEIKETYLGKFKKVNPNICSAMSPQVLLSRLKPEVIERYTRQPKGSEDYTRQHEGSEMHTRQHEGSEKDTRQHKESEKHTRKHEGSEKHTRQHEGSEKHTRRHKGSEKHIRPHKGPEKHTRQHEGSEKHTRRHKESEKHTRQHEESEKHTRPHKESEKHSRQHKESENHTRRHKGKNDQNFSDEKDWMLPSFGGRTNDDQGLEKKLLYPLVQIYENNLREGSNSEHGDRISSIDNTFGDTSIEQEGPGPLIKSEPGCLDSTRHIRSPSVPTLPMCKGLSAILPKYMATPPPAHPSHSFPPSNKEGLFTSSSHQNSSSRAKKSLKLADDGTNCNKDNLVANIKQELLEHVKLVAMKNILHSNEPVAMPDEEVRASPMTSVGSFSTRENERIQKYPNDELPAPEVCDDLWVSGCSRSLKELTWQLQELSNKNYKCDEKIQKLREEYDINVTIIEREKKVNEKEIGRVLYLIHNWKG